jgi:hypothetical protein
MNTNGVYEGEFGIELFARVMAHGVSWSMPEPYVRWVSFLLIGVGEESQNGVGTGCLCLHRLVNEYVTARGHCPASTLSCAEVPLGSPDKPLNRSEAISPDAD